MKYGVSFWCLDEAGARLDKPRWPRLEPFRYHDGDRGFLLLHDYSVEFFYRGKHWIMEVLEGFDFDGASIPRWAWGMIGDPLALDILIAALIHDILFCVHHPDFFLFVANTLFCEIQQASGASWAKRRLTTRAVDIAGWTCWSKTDDEIEKYRYFFRAYEQTAITRAER